MSKTDYQFVFVLHGFYRFTMFVNILRLDNFIYNKIISYLISKYNIKTKN